MPVLQKITPHLWFAKEAEEAARFYVSLFPGSAIDHVSVMPVETPSGPPGSVKVVEFTLAGQGFIALEAGPYDPFNHAISLYVHCEDQAEIDHYWNGLLAGGAPEQCGWLRDRYGVSWQIVPRTLDAMMRAPDREAVKRAAQAMLGMVKLDVAALERAFRG